MKSKKKTDENQLICAKCNVKLEKGTVEVKYLGGNVQVELMKCPSCNLVYIPEELAVGKMLEVEKSLEDK
jgi:uncharacterized protein with PIN domain